MSWLNTKTGRSYDFFAPEAYEGERLTVIPFPIPVGKAVSDDGKVTHDANPALVAVAPAEAATIDVTTKAPAGSLLIVTNTGSANATVGGVSCAFGEVTTLLYDGNGYASIGSTSIIA
jgi:hypothetical protein